MQFIQETGFSFELDQIACVHAIDDLMRRIEHSVACTAGTNYGCIRLAWNGQPYLVWYCVNGDIVTLRSIASDSP